MPYQPINYANIAPIGNPGMRDLVETLMKGYQAAQMPKTTQLQQQLVESEIGKNKSGSSHNQAVADLLTMQLNKMKQMEQSRAGSMQLPQQNSIMQPKQSEPQNNSFPAQMQQQQRNPQSPQQVQQSPMQSNQDDYQQAALVQSLLGLGQPQVIDVNGEKRFISPFGSGTIAKGPTQKEQELTKEDVKAASEFQKDYSGAVKQEPTLEYIGEFTKNPVFRDMRNAWATTFPTASLGYYKKFGTKEQQELAGNFESTVNKFVADSSKTFGSRLTNQDLSFLQSMKVNGNDSIGSIEGKVKALSLFNTAMKDRSKLADQYYRASNISPAQALERAQKETNLKTIQKQIDKSMNAVSPNMKFKSQQELNDYYSSLTPAQRNELKEQLLRENKNA